MPRYLSIDPAIYHLCWSSVSVTYNPISAKHTRKTKKCTTTKRQTKRQKWIPDWYASLKDFHVHSVALVNLANADDKNERKKQRAKYQAIRTLQDVIKEVLPPLQSTPLYSVTIVGAATMEYYHKDTVDAAASSPLASSSGLLDTIPDPLVDAIADAAPPTLLGTPTAITTLDSWLTNDVFLVEEQPKGSSGIAPISFWLNGLLWGQSPSHASHFVHAKHKITAAELYLTHVGANLPKPPIASASNKTERRRVKREQYSYNKKIVTQAVLHMLQTSNQKEVHDFIAKSPKQDDFCDSIMTTLAFAFQHPTPS